MGIGVVDAIMRLEIRTVDTWIDRDMNCVIFPISEKGDVAPFETLEEKLYTLTIQKWKTQKLHILIIEL